MHTEVNKTNNLINNYEEMVMDSNPENSLKSLDNRYNKLEKKKIYYLEMGRKVSGEDLNTFNLQRKLVEKHLGKKIEKKYGNPFVVSYMDYLFITGENKEEISKIEILFSLIKKDSPLKSYSDGGKIDKEVSSILTSQYKRLFPNSKSIEVENLLDEEIDVDTMIKEFGGGSHECIVRNSYKPFYHNYYNINWTRVNNTYNLGVELSNGIKYCKSDAEFDRTSTEYVRLKETDKTYLKNYKTVIEWWENAYQDLVIDYSMNINDFLSLYPELNKKISQILKGKLEKTRKSIDLSFNINFDCLVNVEMDSTEEEIKSKIEEYCKELIKENTLHTNRTIQKKFGDDYFNMNKENKNESSYNYEILKVRESV